MTQVLCSDDGQFLVGIDLLGLIHAWNLNTKSRVSIRIADEKVIQITMAKHYPYLAISMESGQIKLFNLVDGMEISTIECNAIKIRQLAFTPDDRILAGASWEGDIYFWNVETSQLENTIGGYFTPANNMQVSPDNKFLVAGIGSQVKLFNPANLQEIQSLNGNFYAGN